MPPDTQNNQAKGLLSSHLADMVLCRLLSSAGYGCDVRLQRVRIFAGPCRSAIDGVGEQCRLRHRENIFRSRPTSAPLFYVFEGGKTAIPCLKSTKSQRNGP